MRVGGILVLMKVTVSGTQGSTDPAMAPAPSELAAQADALVKDHPECFWFWHPDARIRYLADVRLVVEHLREYGDRRAWAAAQELHRCLSPLFKKRS